MLRFMPGDDPQPVRTGLRSSPDMRFATSQFTAPRDEEYEISGLTKDLRPIGAEDLF